MPVLLQNTNAAKHADKIRPAEQVLVLNQQNQQRESLNSKRPNTKRRPVRWQSWLARFGSKNVGRWDLSGLWKHDLGGEMLLSFDRNRSHFFIRRRTHLTDGNLSADKCTQGCFCLNTHTLLLSPARCWLIVRYSGYKDPRNDGSTTEKKEKRKSTLVFTPC